MADALISWFQPDRHFYTAFSGGADSALVLTAAVRAAGADRVTAVTASSASLPTGELELAAAFASRLGVAHRVIATGELGLEGYVANSRKRCYFCKATLLDEILALADGDPRCLVITGTNADDKQDPNRPGIQAGAERGVGTPLADVGMTKDDVRELSRRWDLPTWDKPALPCLSSRIAFGLRITPLRLHRVDDAEAGIRELLQDAGLRPRDLRVRDLGDRVRVEVDAAILDRVREPGQAGAIAAIVSALGFRGGPPAIEAFASGSLSRNVG